MDSTFSLANRATKLFMASIVAIAVSFGAYGLGRATESSVNNPREGVFKLISSWQPVSSYCPTSCDWDLMQRMVQVSLPAGNYMLSISGLVYNSSSQAVIFDCRVVGESGDVYRAYGQLTLGASEAGMMSLNTYAMLNDDFTRVKLDCGLLSNAVGVQMLDASISAQRVESLRVLNRMRPT